tara:strand:+ start:68 stop:694 length:627 start_codon:yes stop_codon:yes gene_type:complete
MRFKQTSFRHAGVILNEPDFVDQLSNVIGVIDSISDIDLITRHESYGIPDTEKLPKSLSKSINEILKEKLIDLSWKEESPIFQDDYYVGENWRLDFAKDNISIEVGFNHSSVIAWNLIKPVLASELNHVQKAIQTKAGIIITATNNMQKLGGFDNAIGTYEKYLDYLKPLSNMLTVPLLIIGLEEPKTFKIEHEQYKPRKKIGRVVYL